MAAADEATSKLYKEILVSNGITSEVKEILVKTPELAGDQFASICKFVTVTLKDEVVKPLELFVKVSVNNPELAAILKLTAAFERETGFFNSILPDLKRFAREKSGYDGFLEDMFPKCYYSSEELIVLRNVVKDGYSLLNKHVPHDLKTATKVITNLAKFQGASFAYIQHIGLSTFESKYSYVNKVCTWDERNTCLIPWVNTGVHGAIKILSKSPIPGSEEALEYFKSIEHTGIQLAAKLFLRGNQRCPDTIVHADLWNGNVMFTKDPDTQELEKCLFIDLQTIVLGTPALDIQGYCLMSVNHSVLHKHWKDLLQIYYASFSDVVKSLGQSVPFTVEDLEKDFQAKCPAGLIMAMYPAFGFEALETVGSLGEVEGDVNAHFINSTSAVIDQMLQEKGQTLSENILSAYSLFQDIRSGKQLEQ